MLKQIHLSSLSFRKRMGIWLGAVVLFLVILTFTTISYFSPVQGGVVGLFVQFHFEAMVLIGLLGVGIGVTSFYLLSRELQEKSQVVHHQSRLLLTFLTPLEKECVLFLARNNGEAYQSELAKLPNMTRLKAHRIVGKLVDRKIIHLSSHGKANHLYLSDEWKSGLNETV